MLMKALDLIYINILFIYSNFILLARYKSFNNIFLVLDNILKCIIKAQKFITKSHFLNCSPFLANNAWIVVWLEEHLIGAAVVLAIAAITLAFSLASACNGLVESGPYLEKNGLGADIWCTRLLVQNGNNYKILRIIFFGIRQLQMLFTF